MSVNTATDFPVMLDDYTIPGAQEFHGKRVAILGMGISGVASCYVLAKHTAVTLSIWDKNETALTKFTEILNLSLAQSSSPSELAQLAAAADFAALAELTAIVPLVQQKLELAQAVTVDSELATAVLAWQPDLVVIAPGFRENGVVWEALRAAKVEVISEIELAWRLRVYHKGIAAPWLCVTGTNGKTTTVSMLESILQTAGLNGKAIGNIGIPAVKAVTQVGSEAAQAFAVELSSFQLAAINTMQPLASVCLNIDDDHLEWHFSRESYRQAKANIYERAQVACIYPVGDSQVQSMVDQADVQDGARAIGIVIGTPNVGEIGVVALEETHSSSTSQSNFTVIDRAFHPKRFQEAIELFQLADIAHLASGEQDFPLHILKDALAASALARAAGVEPFYIAQGLRNFSLGRHRIEKVSRFGDITWIDDSKATNAHAARSSLLAQKEGKVVWIAGGQAKGSEFTQLVAQVAAQLKAVVVIGTEQTPWQTALAQLNLPVYYVDSADPAPMHTAVSQAYAYAQSGDTVLLAPACASLDQFKSYAARGEAFAQAVQDLAQQR